jgi:3-(3-hydroxy-phenyl)propionate hydroxylase
MINLQQQYLEEYAGRRGAAQPADRDALGQPRDRVARPQNADGVAARSVDTPRRPVHARCGWLVACDGARSGIRSFMDLKLEGNSYEGRFVIADIRVDLPLPTERLAFFDPDWNPGNTVLMHREPHGIWRIDYQLPANETPEQALAPESLKSRIDAQLAMVGHAGVPWEMDWCSVYSARALTLPDYVHGRVLFTGDAAHMLPIFGVRGANTGWQDAQGLMWRLALVAQGVAPETAGQLQPGARGRGARNHRRSGQKHPLHDAAHTRFQAAARRGAVAVAHPAVRGAAVPLAHIAAA